MNPAYRYTDSDIRGNTKLQNAAGQFLINYGGSFEFLVNAQGLILEGFPLGVSTIRGVCNCMLNSVEGRKLLQDAGVTVQNHTDEGFGAYGGSNRYSKKEQRPKLEVVRHHRAAFIIPKQTLHWEYLVPSEDSISQRTHIARPLNLSRSTKGTHFEYCTGAYTEPAGWKFKPSSLCSASLSSKLWTLSQAPHPNKDLCKACINVRMRGGLKR